ncbi:MAG: hypothetical protein JWR24_4485 [Actinoallomurus sp.]|nr:hypothetical protein [Actinoallomurus sp.]
MLAERDLAAGAPARPPAHVKLTAQVWRSGYEMPQAASSADWTGWCFLAATKPAHGASGSVAVLDPRAGCAMTAMPGLPWGRELSFPPTRGSLAVLPGWLTSWVRPLERRQIVIVVAADSAP